MTFPACNTTHSFWEKMSLVSGIGEGMHDPISALLNFPRCFLQAVWQKRFYSDWHFFSKRSSSETEVLSPFLPPFPCPPSPIFSLYFFLSFSYSTWNLENIESHKDGYYQKHLESYFIERMLYIWSENECGYMGACRVMCGHIQLHTHICMNTQLAKMASINFWCLKKKEVGYS